VNAWKSLQTLDVRIVIFSRALLVSVNRARTLDAFWHFSLPSPLNPDIIGSLSFSPLKQGEKKASFALQNLERHMQKAKKPFGLNVL